MRLLDSSDDQIDTSHLKKKPFQPETINDKSKEIVRDVKGKETVDKEEINKKAEVKVQEDTLDDDTSSKYSYGYQDEPTEDYIISPKQKLNFKDVEAQEIRDDVTMQIFREPLCKNLSSSSDGQIFCFGLIRRKKSLKLQKNQIICLESDKESHFQDDGKSNSASIADTESWTTEEISDKKDEVLEIEIEDFDDSKHFNDEYLEYKCKKKKIHKPNKFKQFFTTFSDMFLFTKNKEKYAKPFQKKNCKDSIQTGDDSEGSSSSISSISDERHKLVYLSKTKDYSDIEKFKLRRRHKNSKHLHCFCRKPIQEHQHKMPMKKTKSHDSTKYPYFHSMKFNTKEIPRHLKQICNNTKYYEINESSSCNSPMEKIQFRADYSTLSDTRSSVDSDPSRDRRSSTNEADDNDSYIYTSENNNEKRYDSQSSDNFLSEDFDFSDTSTDFQNKNKILNFAAKNNEEKITEEDKINEDSDEKGFNHKVKVKSDNIQFYRPLADLDLLNIEDKLKRLVQDKLMTVNEIEKSWKQNQLSNEKFDTLIKEKIEKENANAKKKSSLTQTKSEHDKVKKNDKAVGVKESDIKHVHFSKKKAHTIRRKNVNEGAVLNEKNTEGMEHKCSLHSKRQDLQNQKTFVHGFQPIISRRYKFLKDRFQYPRSVENSNDQITLTPTDVKDKTEVIDSHENLAKSCKRPNTKDQGTYVRLKSKKCASEREVDIGTICECMDES